MPTRFDVRAVAVAFLVCQLLALPPADARRRKSGRQPTNSTPIAVFGNDRFVVAVNPDGNSISVFKVQKDTDTKTAEVSVGTEPASVAVTPTGTKAYVTNTVDGTVSVVKLTRRGTATVTKTIQVGTEPVGAALTPNGRRLFVSNFRSGDVSVIDTKKDSVVATTPLGGDPWGVAVSPDGKHVYVSDFFARPRAGGIEGADDGREGHVSVLDAKTNAVVSTITLPPLTDTGFLANGTTLGGVPLRTNPDGSDVFDTRTGAFPNQLRSIVIRGDRAYLPNVGASPNGPFRFNVNVQSLLNVVDVGTNADSGQTIDMNAGVQNEADATQLFVTNPFAVAFDRRKPEGWVTAGGINQIVRVTLDGSGTPTIGAPSPVRVTVGKEPRGIAINAKDTRAYVMNFISRDVSVVDLTKSPPTELGRMGSTALPAAGSSEAAILHGKELFDTSVGPAGTAGGSLPPGGRMSSNGWSSCSSCHPGGLTDNVTWMFPNGPRQTISLDATFDPGDRSRQRVLNWSAVRDEVADFELNIRGVSGGQGLIALSDGSQDPNVFNLTGTTSGRSSDWDDIVRWVQSVRAPISPIRGQDVSAGRQAFGDAGCASCHGGTAWTLSLVDFTPPPASANVTSGQLTPFLVDVGTFRPTAPNEVKPNLTTIPQADGSLGFNVPSLLGVFGTAPYLHDGSAATLDDVLANVQHRSAGTGGTDTLADASKRADLVRFLQSIDSTTTPFTPTTPFSVTLLTGYEHTSPSASVVCGRVLTSPPQPGATGTAVLSGTQSGTASLTFDGTGQATFTIPITSYGTYVVHVTATSGSQMATGMASLGVGPTPGTCP